MYDFKTVFSSNHLRFTQVSNRIWSSFPGSVSQSNLDFTGIICDRENWVPWRAFRDWMEKISAHLHTWAAEQLAKVAKGHRDDCHLAPQNPSVYLRHPHGLPRQKGDRWPHHSFAFQMPMPQTGVLTLVKAFPTTFKQLKKSLTRCPWRSSWYRSSTAAAEPPALGRVTCSSHQIIHSSYLEFDVHLLCQLSCFPLHSYYQHVWNQEAQS